MTYELATITNQAQQQYVTRYAAAYRRAWLSQPGVWLQREPEIEEKMLRDADIAHAVGFRCHLVAGRQWTLLPKKKGSSRADLSVDVGSELLSEIRDFTEARALLSRAFFHGQRCARIHGESRLLTIGDGVRRWWWVPTRLEDVDARENRIVPHVDPKTKRVTAHWDRFNYAAMQWEALTEDQQRHLILHTYQDEQGALGFGRGLREALGLLWYTKTNVMDEAMRAIERHAGGLVHAKVEGARDATTNLPNEEVQRNWRDVLEDARARHTLVSDRADEIEIITGGAEGWQMFTSTLDMLSSKIVTLVLSANLPTTASKGGSYALAQEQGDSTEALVQFDREKLEETLTRSLVRLVWWRNHPNLVELGLQDEQPRFNILQDKKLDPEKRANVANLLHTMGAPIALEDLYEQVGFRKPQEGEEVLAGAVPVAPGGPGGPGGGQPDMFNHLFGFRPPAPPSPPDQQRDGPPNAREETNQPPAAAKAS